MMFYGNSRPAAYRRRFSVLTAVIGIMFFAGGMVFAGNGNKKIPFPSQSKKRIAEIVRCLPPKVSVLGAHVSDRKAWDALAELESAEKIIGRAEALLTSPMPECPDDLYLEYSKTGNRRNYQLPYNRRINAVEMLAVAECLENKGRFLSKLAEYLEAICAERSWTLPAHDSRLRVFDGKEMNVDLGAGARAWECAWAVSALKGKLSPVLAQKVIAEIERRVFAPYRERCSRSSGFSPMGWWNGRSNWTAVCHSCVVRAALCVLESRIDRATFIEAAERMMPYYISGFSDDGYCSEGMGYWNYGWGHFLTLAVAVRDVTGGKVDFSTNPKMRKIMEFGTGLQLMEGEAPDFADGGGRVSIPVLALGRRLWPDIPVPSSAVNLDPLSGGTQIFTLRAFGQEKSLPESRVGTMPIRSAFPIGQVWVCRPNPMDNSAWFTVGFKGGHNAELHNHNDIGSYSVLFDGVKMAGDPGNTEYTALTFGPKRYTIPIISSYGHPVPVLNGQCQKAGVQFRPKSVTKDFTADIDTVTMEISTAYPHEAKIRSLLRTFVYNRKEKSFTVVDKALFKTKGTFSVPVLTFGMMTPTGVPGRYKLTANAGDTVRDCTVEISVNGAEWTMSEKRIDNPNRKAPMRYSIDVKGPVTKVEVAVKFIPRVEVIAEAVAGEAPPPDAAEEELKIEDGPVLYDDEKGVKAAIVCCGLEERVYAREIRWYLGEMADESFAMTEKEPASGPAVVIKADDGGGKVFTRNGRVYISGRGSELSKAVSHFLESVGIRCLAPGENGFSIPGMSMIMCPESDWQSPPNPVPAVSPSKKELISLLKGAVKKRGFYEWHGVDEASVASRSGDGWDLYKTVKNVDENDKKAVDALFADYRRAAFGPAARIMGEYYAEKAKASPDRAKLAEILGRAAIEASHDPIAAARIAEISSTLQ